MRASAVRTKNVLQIATGSSRGSSSDSFAPSSSHDSPARSLCLSVLLCIFLSASLCPSQTSLSLCISLFVSLTLCFSFCLSNSLLFCLPNTKSIVHHLSEATNVQLRCFFLSVFLSTSCCDAAIHQLIIIRLLSRTVNREAAYCYSRHFEDSRSCRRTENIPLSL